ncbi:MAG: FliI/YscN family ATPase [Pseudomonadota bacterium]
MLNVETFNAEVSRLPVRYRCGRLSAADGASIEIVGLGRKARIGDQIHVGEQPDGPGLAGEIVALSHDSARAMIFDASDGLGIGAPVWLRPDHPLRPSEAWLGRVLDAFGQPLDGSVIREAGNEVALRGHASNASLRRGLGLRLKTGLAVTDTILPITRGQRIGVFAGSGVGKSRFLTQLAQGIEADVVVYALIGERGRELNEFVRKGLPDQTAKRAVVIAATSDQSPLVRRRALWTALAAAESFRDRGRHVLLLVDSLTRFAEAHREIALTAGETPSLRAFPPSTTHLIAHAAERTGPGEDRDGIGDITAIFSVLVAGSDMDEPIADITRGILDGHIVLDRGIAERGRFPAIDVLKSVSRSLPDTANDRENMLISQTRRYLNLYESARPMIQTGLYQAGTDPDLDRAVGFHAPLEDFFATSGASEISDRFERLSKILQDPDPS